MPLSTALLLSLYLRSLVSLTARKDGYTEGTFEREGIQLRSQQWVEMSDGAGFTKSTKGTLNVHVRAEIFFSDSAVQNSDENNV